jgi:hypothetical protein
MPTSNTQSGLDAVVQEYAFPDVHTGPGDVFWFIKHYVSYCREHGIPINKKLWV